MLTAMRKSIARVRAAGAAGVALLAALLVLSSASLGWVLRPAADAGLPRGQYLVYGPEDFARGAGKPTAAARTFAVGDASAEYLMRLDNGGSRGQFSKTSSAVVAVGGREVFGPADFNRNAGVIERGVSLSASNTLSVELRGAPGSGLTVRVVGIDNDPPSITASAAPAPNARGWNNTDVSVSFNCSDATSGVASCTAPQTIANEGVGQVVTGTAVDNAQNEASASVTLNVDKTLPSLSINSPAAGANVNAGEVNITGSAGDALSGVVSVTCGGSSATLNGASFSCRRALAAGTNLIPVEAMDAAGNRKRVSLTVMRQEGETLRGVSLQPDVVFVGESKAVTVTARVPYAGTIPPAVTLERLDESGGVAGVEGALLDNGSAASGDALKGDGVFTFRRAYAAQSPGRLRFRVSYQKDGRTVASEPLQLGFYEHMTTAQIDSILSTQQSAAALYTSLAPAPGGDAAADEEAREAYEAARAAAREAVVAHLRQNPGVIEAGVSDDGGMISVLHSPGVVGGIYLKVPGARGGGSPSSAFTSDTSAAASRMTSATLGAPAAANPLRALGAAHTSAAPLAPQESGEDEEDEEENKIRSRRALILSPFYWQFAVTEESEESEELKQKLETAACCGFDVTYLSNQAVTVEHFKGLHQYGVVAVISHGGTIWQGLFHGGDFNGIPLGLDVYTTLTSQEVTQGLALQYESDILSARLATITVAETGNNKTYFSILPPFISHYSPEEFPNTLVYMGTCYSTANDTMARAFFGQGADTYLGFSKIVPSSFAAPVGLAFFDRFLNDPLRKTGGEDGAFIPGQYEPVDYQWELERRQRICARNPQAPLCVDEALWLSRLNERVVRFDMFGSEELERPGILVNAGFEAGSMSNWYSTFPSSRAVGQLGEFRPTAGRYFGMVSKIESWFGLVAQDFCLPADATRVEFDWNLLTTQGCGSPFLRSDELWVRITAPGVYHQVLTTGVTAQCASLRSSSVGLPAGGARATGWRHGSFDITDLAQRMNGQRVQLRFEVVKAVFNGDQFGDTVVLVDNVKIVR